MEGPWNPLSISLREPSAVAGDVRLGRVLYRPELILGTPMAFDGTRENYIVC